MRQSNFIAGALFVAFVVYITLKGELGRYLGFLGLGKGTASQNSPAFPFAGQLPSNPAGTPSAAIAVVRNPETGQIAYQGISEAPPGFPPIPAPSDLPQLPS